MTDHHDWTGDHHDDHDPGDPVFHDEPSPFDDPHPYGHDPYDLHDDADDTPDPGLYHHADLDADRHTPEPGPPDDVAHTATGHEPADTHDPGPADADVADPGFPPTLDVDLPEPVDGFPWIDTGSLGVVDPATLAATPVDPVDPHELAEYAGAELPPGADPWATLAESDDPATAALARWWAENQ